MLEVALKLFDKALVVAEFFGFGVSQHQQTLIGHVRIELFLSELFALID